ncbi:MAG: hypothetical protein ACREQM_20370 [Candidatus Dormibacteraceae bacterium]
MAGPADLDKQIGSVRDSMESSIVVLRDRGKRQLRRVEKMALIAVGAGAAVGVIVVGVVLIRRLRRPPTRRERIERLIPLGWWDRLRSGYAKQVPPMRLYVGDRQVGEEARRPMWEASAARIARTVGTAAGTAIAGQVVSQVLRRLRDRGGSQPA